MPDTSKGNIQPMDFGGFTIQAPRSWKKMDGAPGDENKATIVLDQSDTVQFNSGPNVRDVSFYQELVVTHGTIISIVKENDDNGEMTEISTEDSRTSETIRSDVHLQKMDGIEAEILIPKKPGNGAVGIFLNTLAEPENRFNLFGVNLKPENEKAFLAALKTLKFHNTR
jgi:hypothetical protein